MDYDSDEFVVIETCTFVLKYTITHTIRYTDGLGEDPDASVSILDGTVHISSHFGFTPAHTENRSEESLLASGPLSVPLDPHLPRVNA